MISGGANSRSDRFEHIGLKPKAEANNPYPGACEICSGYWLTYAPDAKAVALGESEEFLAEVRRCRHCGTYWEVGAFSYPQVISPEQARRELPNLDALEAAWGINFPEPKEEGS